MRSTPKYQRARPFVLGLLVAALVAGACGVRPIYLGSGGAGAVTPVTLAPTWEGRDTAATYATGLVTRNGYLYNEQDRNRFAGGYVHRAWVRKNHNITAGALGYDGSYALNALSGTYVGAPDHRLSYSGAGGVLGVSYHLADKDIEVRPFVGQLSVVREWGRWTDLRQNPLFNSGTSSGSPGVVNLNGRWLTTLSGSAEAQSRPRHKGWPVVGVGLGGSLMAAGVGFFGRVWIGKGPFWLHAQWLGGGGKQIDGVGQFGLTVKLPPYRRRR